MDQQDRRQDPVPLIADAMLGKLARWLRLLGFDVLYDPSWDDAAIARRAAREGRVVLTRDHGLLERRLVRRGLLVESEQVGPQLRQVLDALGLGVEPGRMFSRCAACNTPVIAAGREDVRGEVPPFVLRRHETFARCPGCGRVYWGGSHRELAEKRLRALLGEPGAGEPAERENGSRP
jgi:hypothetical protein